MTLLSSYSSKIRLLERASGPALCWRGKFTAQALTGPVEPALRRPDGGLENLRDRFLVEIEVVAKNDHSALPWGKSFDRARDLEPEVEINGPGLVDHLRKRRFPAGEAAVVDGCVHHQPVKPWLEWTGSVERPDLVEDFDEGIGDGVFGSGPAAQDSESYT